MFCDEVEEILSSKTRASVPVEISESVYFLSEFLSLRFQFCQFGLTFLSRLFCQEQVLLVALSRCFSRSRIIFSSGSSGPNDAFNFTYSRRHDESLASMVLVLRGSAVRSFFCMAAISDSFARHSLRCRAKLPLRRAIYFPKHFRFCGLACPTALSFSSHFCFCSSMGLLSDSRSRQASSKASKDFRT